MTAASTGRASLSRQAPGIGMSLLAMRMTLNILTREFSPFPVLVGGDPGVVWTTDFLFYSNSKLNVTLEINDL